MRKLVFICAILIVCLTQCKQPKHTKVITLVHYRNGNIEDSLTLNSDSLKNGKCFYFDDEDGSLDSIVTFENGKRNGLKSKFFGEYGTQTYWYKNDTLQYKKFYDTLNKVTFYAPLDVTKVPKASFKLKSNKNYFDENKGDTITLITPNLPRFNQSFNISGALFKNLDPDAGVYILLKSKHSDSTKNVIIHINMCEQLAGRNTIADRIDTITIPIKK